MVTQASPQIRKEDPILHPRAELTSWVNHPRMSGKCDRSASQGSGETWTLAPLLSPGRQMRGSRRWASGLELFLVPAPQAPREILERKRGGGRYQTRRGCGEPEGLPTMERGSPNGVASQKPWPGFGETHAPCRVRLFWMPSGLFLFLT